MAKNKLDRPPKCDGHPKDQDFFQRNSPPPPPGDENEWELQYCRWWGWNWVKKPIDKKDNQKKPPEEKKVEKKCFKNLCNCLCFKKRPKEPSPSLQNLYSTPSNSVVLRETYTCGVLQRGAESISCLEVQRNISRKDRRRVYRNNANQTRYKVTESSSCSCPECQVAGATSSGSTQPSRPSDPMDTDVQNFDNQCLCIKGKLPPRKTNFQSQIPENGADTVGSQTNKRRIDDPDAKIKTKKKHYHLVCCHHCCCCCCNKQKSQEQGQKENVIDDYPDEVQEQAPLLDLDKFPPCNECRVQVPNAKEIENGTRTIKKVNERQPVTTCYNAKDTWLLNNKFLSDFKPWDRQLYANKSFSKFGVPSQKYPWIQSTKSDILDKYYTTKLSDEFFSPLSGKTFNLNPVHIDSFDGITTSSLPDPLEVEDDIRYLNHLEKQVKMDLESRVMLDAVCDAILHDKRAREEPSVLLDKFDYVEEPEKAFNAPGCSYNAQRGPILSGCPGAHLESSLGVARDYAENSLGVHGSQVVTNSETYRPTVHQIHQETSEQAILEEIRDLLRKLYLSRNVNSIEPDREGMKIYSKTNNSPRHTPTAVDETTKVSNKRTASPAPTEPVKKMKRVTKKRSSGDSLTKNVNNIFEKIDEIATKGLVNVEKIQNVINRTGNRNDDDGQQQIGLEISENVCDNPTNDNLDIMNTSEIFHKIDEIIMRSKNNSDDIQNVLKTIPRRVEASRDYVNYAYASQSKTHRAEEKPAEEYPFQLPVISESADENFVEEDVVETSPNSKNKAEPKTDRVATTKKKKKSKQSLIPVKQTTSVTAKKK